MADAALTTYQFTIDKAIAEWLEQKRLRTGSQKTYDAYSETMQSFRQVLSCGNIDLLDNPTDIQRLAAIWANTRNGKSRRPGEDVSPSTYNQRLTILSSFYTFLQEVYHLDIPNPIESVKKRPVQAMRLRTRLNLKPLSRALRASIGPHYRGCVIMQSWPWLLPLVAVPMSLSPCGLNT